MKNLTYILTFFISFAVISCKKGNNPTRWDTNIVAPVVYGDLTINDLLTDTILEVNNDNSIQLNFNSNIYELNFDSLVKIPDTTMINDYFIPYSTGINFSPGQTFITQPENTILQISDVELTEIKVLNGSLHYTLNSNIFADIIYEYQITNAFDENGNMFSKTVTVPSASSSNAFVSGEFSLDGYTIDLRGVSANAYNTLSTLVKMTLAPSNTNDLVLSNQDTVHLANTISNLTLEYAKGYFGNQTISIPNESSKINTLNNITNGTIDLEQVSIDFTIKNGIGADASFNFQNLLSIKNGNTVALNHAIIGSSNFLNRATFNGANVVPSVFSTVINSSNSNIENWIENLPDSVRYSLNLEINPLGNIANHNDFIYKNAPFSVNMGIDMPLRLLANNLTLTDTITINTSDIENILSGNLHIFVENGFPLQANISVKNQAGGNELYSNTTINAGMLDNSGIVISPTESIHKISFGNADIEQLKQSNKLIIKVEFSTPTSAYGLLNIYDYYHLKFKVNTDFIYQSSIN